MVIYICKLKDLVIKLVLKNTYQYYYHLQLENKVLDNNAAYQEVLEDTKDVIRIRNSKKNTMAKRKSTKGQATIYETYT